MLCSVNCKLGFESLEIFFECPLLTEPLVRSIDNDFVCLLEMEDLLQVRVLLIDLKDQVELAGYVHRLQSPGLELCTAMLDAIMAYTAPDQISY